MASHTRGEVGERSLRYSIRDGVAYSVMSGAGETYFSAFALYLKASTAQIGWLASVPPLLGSFAQLLSVVLGRLTGRRMLIILAGAGLQGLTWLPLIVLPLLFREHAVAILIACVTVYFICANLAIPQWNSLMGDLVPERRRGRYFARRNGLASITAFLSLVLAGLVLYLFAGWGHAAAGFVTVFLVAALGRGVSVYYLAQMQEPSAPSHALEIPVTARWWQRLKESAFFRFSLFYALIQCAVAIAAPFFTVYMLRDLQYSYLQFMINTATSILFQVATLNIWGRVGDQFGNRRILVLTGWVIPVMPALWMVSDSYLYLLCLQALGGLIWAGFSLSASNFFYDLVPSGRRPTYTALHNVLAGIGIFVGALAGGYLGTVMPQQWALWGMQLETGSTLFGVFLISSVTRLAVVAMFLPRVREVRSVRRLSVGGMVFRVARYNALSGLIFDVVGRRISRRG